MKKISALLAVLLLILCSCSKKEPQKIITADMLSITNTEKSFFGCRKRYNSVVSALKAKVNVLEAEHNRQIKSSSSYDYFLENDYILTSFEPFVSKYFYITESFTSDLDSDGAKLLFETEAADDNIVYESDGKTSFDLKFVSEELVKEFSVEYSKENDGFRYIYQTDDNQNGKSTVEFIEFSTAEDGTYIIQSADTRCVIRFDEDGHIIDFCCGRLNGEYFSQEESIFDVRTKSADKYWVLSKGKLKFLNIHTYENDVLTHEDCSSGPWKTVEIEAKNYESAFYT